MATLFYVLVMAQIALGIYSLWNGFEWFRMVRRRLTSHAGFYAPTTALICPCKGNERGLEDNLMALTRFEYANYEIYFTLATSLDPALKIIERVKAASSKPVHIVIAGRQLETRSHRDCRTSGRLQREGFQSAPHGRSAAG